MSTTTNSTTYSPDSDAIEVREALGERDGYFSVTLPLSSTRRARDGDAFSADRLRGFAQQINGDRTVPVFLSHGRSELSEDRYGALGKIGRVRNATVETRDGTSLLEADLEIADPDDLAEEGDTGDVEEALRWVRQQFRLGLGAVSVGWNEDLAGRDVPGDAELLEVSVVGIESDTEAQQAAAEPTAAAVRGFEALPSRADSRDSQPLVPEFWRDDDATDEEGAAEALDALEHVREHHTRDDDVPPWKRRDETPPVLATIDELRRLWGHDRDSVTIEERLAELVDDERQREDVLARLDEVEKYAGKLAQPTADEGAYNRPAAKVYPFGRSRDESIDRITEACETLRGLVSDGDPFEGWGMAAYMEARE